jgi:two-component SAPR family response regulator
VLPNLNELAYYIIKPITLENLKKALDRAINDAGWAE